MLANAYTVKTEVKTGGTFSLLLPSVPFATDKVPLLLEAE